MPLQISWKDTRFNWQMYTSAFAKKGFKLIGEGTFSAVFENPGNAETVIKIFRVHRNANSLTWLQWCYDNPSKYVPKVFNADGFKDLDGQLFVCAEIEKLESVHPNRRFLVDWCAKYGMKNCVIKGRAELELTAEHASDCVAFPEVHKIVTEILRLSKNDFMCQDLTAENLFVVADELVFADPVTGGNIVSINKQVDESMTNNTTASVAIIASRLKETANIYWTYKIIVSEWGPKSTKPKYACYFRSDDPALVNDMQAVTLGQFFKSSLPDKTTTKTQDDYIQALASGLKQFKNKVEFNSWAKATPRTFEERIAKLKMLS